MKKIFIPLLTAVMVVSIILAGCVPGAAPAPPVTPPPVEPPVTPPPVEPPVTPPEAPAPENPLEGVGIKPDGAPYTFVDVPCYLLNDWAVGYDGCLGNIIKKSGAEYIVLDPNLDLEKQIWMIEDSTMKGVGGIFVLPIDSAALAPAVDKAWQAGIPTMTAAMRIYSDNLCCTAMHDSVEMGRTCGKWLVDYAETTNTHLYIYEIWHFVGMECHLLRHQGYHEILDGHPLVTMVGESPDTYSLDEKAMEFTVDFLPTHPEVNTIITTGTLSGGVIEALRVIGRLYPVGDPQHVMFTTTDEDPTTMRGIRNGYIDMIAGQSPWEDTDLVAKAMLTYVCLGKPVPKEIFIPIWAVDATNVDGTRYGADAIWGNKELTNFDTWPVLDFSEEGIKARGEGLLLLDGVLGGFETPTVAMRKELLGY